MSQKPLLCFLPNSSSSVLKYFFFSKIVRDSRLGKFDKETSDQAKVIKDKLRLLQVRTEKKKGPMVTIVVSNLVNWQNFDIVR